jgi:DNA-binding NtrC family response regulator
LQEKRIKRIGENQFRQVNARIISATHKDLRQEVKEKRFREDLFFRMNVIPIHLPPLRQRKEDILPLAEFFLKKFSALNGKKIEGFQKSALEYLLKYQWPGNVRELENAVERAVVLCEANSLAASDLILDYLNPPTESATDDGELLKSAVAAPAESKEFYGLIREEEQLVTLEELTNRYLSYALEKNRGAKDKTARDLGIDRKTLYRRLQDSSRGKSREMMPPEITQ